MAQHASGRRPNRAERRAKRADEAALAGAADPALRERVLEFIAEHPERATKRDIARAFDLKGDDRIALKHMLKELQGEGALEKSGKRLHEPGSLPSVTILNVTGRDRDGGLVGEPAEERLGEVRVRILPGRGSKAAVPGVGDRVLVRTSRDGDEWTARVMKVVSKRPRTSLGVYRERGDGGVVEPVDRRGDLLTVAAGDEGGARDGDLVEVDGIGGTRHGPGRGRVREVLGSVASERAVSMIAIHALGIPHVFPNEVVEAAEAVRAITPDRMGEREDWRHLPLVTIDPATAKDHDDAVMGEADPDDAANPGGVIATVAIADVAAYVAPGGALDVEARKRGNSVYFPDRVVPMLPERISNDLCSLRPNEDRPALAVRMVFAADGTKRRHSFHRVLMRSPAKLAYEEAQAAFDGGKPDAARDHADTLDRLLATYRVMLKGRERREPLEIDVPERRLRLHEDGTVAGVEVPPRLLAHKLIEEFMVQANVCAAETLESKRTALIYRTHEPPALAKVESLREFLRSLEIGLSKGVVRTADLNAILRRVADGDHAELVNQVVLRSQSQAEYNPDNLGHFGLNLARYAHFTSPIRRYADLVVHRALIAALGLGEGGMMVAEIATLPDTAEHISMTERRAMQAERDTTARLIAAFLSEKVGASFTGRVSGVTRAGLFVTLDDTGADGFVPAATLGDEFFAHDESQHALVGADTGLGFQLGDTIEVRLVEAAPVAGALRFEALSDPKAMPAGTRSAHKARAARKRRPVLPRRSGRGRRRA